MKAKDKAKELFGRHFTITHDTELVNQFKHTYETDRRWKASKKAATLSVDVLIDNLDGSTPDYNYWMSVREEIQEIQAL